MSPVFKIRPQVHLILHILVPSGTETPSCRVPPIFDETEYPTWSSSTDTESGL